MSGFVSGAVCIRQLALQRERVFFLTGTIRELRNLSGHFAQACCQSSDFLDGLVGRSFVANAGIDRRITL
jgi:hypothetical protein